MGFISGLLGGSQSQLANQAQQGAGATTAQQQAFVNALAGQNGIGNQSQVYNQLQGVANGTGPNPALEQLRLQTGQNVAQQAALMGSQRGVGSNPGLLARQAAMQGANIQQNGVGQAAALQAQQQLNALGALGNLATQQVNQQGNALNSLSQQQLGLAQSAGQTAKQNVQNAGGLLGGLGQVIASFADGGQVPQPQHMPFNNALPSTPDVPGSFLARSLRDSSGGPPMMSSGGHVPGHAQVSGDSQKNDTVPAMLSPGEIVVPRSHAMDPAKAAAFAYRIAARKGRK